MENLSYVTRPLLGPAFPDSLYETFPPLPACSSYLQVAPNYYCPPRSLSILKNTEALSSVYSFLKPFACRRWSHFWRSFLPRTLNLLRSLRGLAGVVRDLVGSRLGRVPPAKRETQDEFSTGAIFLTCMPCFPSSLTLWKGHTVSDSASSMVVWYICSSHSTLPSRRPRFWVVPSLFAYNIFSLIPVYFLGFVSPVNVCPASSQHTLSPRFYELFFLSSTPFVGENCSWRRMGASCVRS